jgi:hypothetical protein
MNKIEVLSDGRAVMGDVIYPSKESAESAKRCAKGKRAIEALVDANIPYSDNQSMVRDFVFENPQGLLSALTDYLSPMNRN